MEQTAQIQSEASCRRPGSRMVLAHRRSLPCSVISRAWSLLCAWTPKPTNHSLPMTLDVVLSDLGWSFDPEQMESPGLPLPDLGPIEGLATVGLASDRDQATDAWRAGYRSLVLRSESPAALVAALHAAASGLWVLSPELAGSLSASVASDVDWQFEELTDREHQVLALLAEGLTNRAIAHRLEISEHTVKFHVNSILGKLGAESRTDAVVRATRAGLILL